MASVELRNKSEKSFTDISSEAFRRYVFSGGDEVVIRDPQWLSVSDNGHRVLDGEGVCHYIPLAWIHLTWEVKAGQPHFVK